VGGNRNAKEKKTRFSSPSLVQEGRKAELKSLEKGKSLKRAIFTKQLRGEEGGDHRISTLSRRREHSSQIKKGGQRSSSFIFPRGEGGGKKSDGVHFPISGGGREN